jgi:hypothetical protein
MAGGALTDNFDRNVERLEWQDWMPCWANRRPRLFTGGDKAASHRHHASLYSRGRLYAQAYD